MQDSRLLVVLLAALASALPSQAKPVDYESLGKAWLKDIGEATVPELPELLDRHYARLLLADFDLRVPKGMLAKTADAGKVAAIAGALLDLQDRLAELTIADQVALKARRTEIATLRKYVTAWRNKPGASEPPPIAARPQPCILVIAPDRKNFVGFVGWLGMWKQVYRDRWWNDATAQFSDVRLEDEGEVQVVAIEYAAPNQNGDVNLGFDMNTRERTGMLQHVLQRAGLSWCWRWLGDGADTTFVLGFATDLVVDVLGQNNARSGGSGKSHSTEGDNAFIPGAPGQGGSMQMVNADSGWRLSQGQDYFARVLRQAQKAGEHEAADSKDKFGHFLLRNQKGDQKHLVNAPFLGHVAFERERVPDAFGDDYLEFHRAYRAAFVHWLQDNGAKGKSASAERFRILLLKLTEQKEGVTFESLCQELYGIPLAAKASDVDTLERRFLAAIAENSR